MQFVAMVYRLLLVLAILPVAYGADSVNFLPHNRHGHKAKKVIHKAHGHASKKLAHVVKHAKVDPTKQVDVEVTSTTHPAPSTTTTLVPIPAAVAVSSVSNVAASFGRGPLPNTQGVLAEEPETEVQPQSAVGFASVAGGEGVEQLKADLAEMKQSRAHIGQLEQALREGAALLRETSKLEHVSKSERGRASAGRQVKQAAELVKSTESMLRESRADAADRSKEMLHEASVAQKAADALNAEAAEQMKLYGDAMAPSASEPLASEQHTATPAEKSADTSADEDLADIEDEN